MNNGNNFSTITEVEESIYAKLGEVREQCKVEMNKLLEETGYDKDVRNKRTGDVGRLIVSRDSNRTIGYAIKFFKYTKAGSLGKVCDAYCYNLTDYEPCRENIEKG